MCYLRPGLGSTYCSKIAHILRNARTRGLEMGIDPLCPCRSRSAKVSNRKVSVVVSLRMRFRSTEHISKPMHFHRCRQANLRFADNIGFTGGSGLPQVYGYTGIQTANASAEHPKHTNCGALITTNLLVIPLLTIPITSTRAWSYYRSECCYHTCDSFA